MLKAEADRVRELAKKNLFHEMTGMDRQVFCEIYKDYLPKRRRLVADLQTGFVDEKEFTDLDGLTDEVFKLAYKKSKRG